MKQLFFGSQVSTLMTVCTIIFLLMAFAVPLADQQSFKEAGTGANLFWLGYWLISVPGMVHLLVMEQRKRHQTALVATFH